MSQSTRRGRAEKLLGAFKEQSPLHAAVIDALGPVILLREELLEADDPALEAGASKLLRSGNGTPDDAENAALARAAGRMLDALAEGFPAARERWDALRAALENNAGLTADLFRAGRGESDADALARAAGISPDAVGPVAVADALSLAAAQFSRICSAVAARNLPAVDETANLNSRLCPWCGARPELSFISGQDGHRCLVCSQCARQWRHTRSACPGCGNDGGRTIRHIYETDVPELRAALCETCRTWLLEADLRKRNIPVDLAHLAGLVMGHLDALAAQEDAEPLALVPTSVILPREASHA